MGRSRGSRASRRLAEVAAAAGFRRVQHVHLIVGPDGTSAEALGVLHRYSRTVRISLATAARLVAAGAPVQIDAGAPAAGR